MNKSFFFLATALFAMLMATPDLAFGKPPPARRHETVISSVTRTSITIQEDHGPKTFVITRFTEIDLNGQKATVGDLRPQMRVSVTLDDPLRAHRIDAWSTR